MKIDGFLLAMLGSVTLALCMPELGSAQNVLHLPLVTTLGVSLVFFLHGAALAPAALRAGLVNWRLHLLVQTSTYVLFPAMGFALFLSTETVFPLEARLGIFYLCALSSTISSSVAMTALGKGNVPGAIFNATLSGLIGIFLTPLLVGFVVNTSTNHIDIWPAILEVVQKLLLPFAAGQALRPLLVSIVTRYKPWITIADRSVIVLIVFVAFSQTTASGMWEHYSAPLLIGIALTVAGLLVAILTITTSACRLLGMSREDEVAGVFCGSKKSLANGAPIAAILFGGTTMLGMLMLPLMLYHQLQLIICSILARRYAEREREERDSLPASIAQPAD